MSHSKLINPKKKRRVFANKESPFPVPIASITGEPPSETQWMYYTGNLVGNQVIVHHSGDISFLYKMGFFGKGTLSRSKPEFNQRCKMATLPTSGGGNNSCRVISRRSYIRRLNWKSGKSNSQQDEYDSSQELEFWEEERNPMDIETNNVQHSDSSSINIKEDFKNTFKKDLIGPEISNSIDDDEWSAAVESWDNAEADEDFWGTGSDNRTADIPSSSKETAVISNVAGGKQDFDAQEFSKCNEDNLDVKSPMNISIINLQREHSSLDDEPDVTGEDEKCLKLEQSKSVPNYEEHVSQVDLEVNHQTTVSQLCFKETKRKDSQNEQEKETREADPLCLSEEKYGDLFVVEDSDNEAESGKRKWKEPPWKPVVKEDPYFVKEFLHLSLEESFFLAYGLGCLRVYENEKLLNLTELWKTFCQRHDRFIPLYIAYHYFRSKGWVPKSGLKFGTDFIIYKEGPPFYHGSYSVIVKMVRDDDLKEEDNLPTLTWTQIAGLNRLTEHVAKQLLICYVVRPTHVNSELMLSPNVISQFKVKEIVVSRWVSSQERESKSTEEIP